MSELDLVAIQARVNAATKGFWVVNGNDENNYWGVVVEQKGSGEDQRIWHVPLVELTEFPEFSSTKKSDANFIAHAHQDIPVLIGRIQELEQEVSFLRQTRPKRTPISTAQRFRILHRDSFTCQYCFRNGGPDLPLEIDHVVPTSKGGTNEDINLKTACYDCNRGKRDMELNVK
jgi:HNH endonuclease